MTGNATQIVTYLMAQEDRDKLWDLKEHKEKRSNDANSYFWALVNELAINQNLSDTEVHDKYLSENRYYFYNEDGSYDWKVTPQEPNAYGLIKEWYFDENGKKQAKYYIYSEMQVSLCKEDGSQCHYKNGTKTTGLAYWRIKGTHEMNTAEMSRVISSVVADAEACGIDTMPKRKLKELLESWGIK